MPDDAMITNTSMGNLCGIGFSEAGITKGTVTTYSTVTCLEGINEGGTFTKTTKDITYAVWCKVCECEEDLYCITRTFTCLDGKPLAMEYYRCQDDVPVEYESCGNMGLAEMILNVEREGGFRDFGCMCSMTLDQIGEQCAKIESGQDCGIEEECEFDEDCDGVEDDHDLCPGTPYGVLVDGWGCPVDEDNAQDTDGDGVDDEDDYCPNTLPDAVVDPNGCEIDNPQAEPDPDGGDQDNDNALLEGVISWLKKLAGIDREIENNTDEIEELLEEMTGDGNVNTDIAGTEYTEDMPEGEIEEIGEGENIMTSFLSDMLTNNPISQFVSGATLDTSSSNCSLNCPLTVLGSSVELEFTMCEYEDELQTFGSMLMGLTTLICFLIVFKR